MIASLSGKLLELTTQSAVIEVSGVGYLVHITPSTSSKLSPQSEVNLRTSLVVREESLTLYGFLRSNELSLFELLLSVSGVGPKLALGILEEMSIGEIVEAVAKESDESFRKVSGVGSKTAKLIVMTLAGKLNFFEDSGMPANIDLVSGLTGLGWSEKEARLALAEVASPGLSDEESLKLALRLLGELKGKKR